MDLVFDVVSKILEPVVAPIKRHIGYAFEFRSTRTAFSGETRKLKLAKEGLQDSIAAAEGRGDKIKPRVLDWLTDAERAIVEAEALVQEGQEEAQRCCSFNLMTRYHMGKRLVEGKPVISQLLGEKDMIGPDLFESHELRQIVPPPINEAQSRTGISKGVMGALLDPNIPMVGVYGMGGIGKTTLANEIHRQVTHDKSFDKVVIVLVSATPDISKIQDLVAELVIGSSFKLEGNAIPARAADLNKRLMVILENKRILIILDDLWDKLDLDKVGIPTWNDRKNCKILLTSRNQGLLCEMGSNKNFGLRILSKEESRNLFEKKVITIEYPEIADNILAICDGFPLMIVTVAGLLKMNRSDSDAWKDVFTHLHKFRDGEVEKKVYSVLELSYNRLVDTQTKKIFLLFGLCCRSDSTLIDLLRYSMGLGLFKNYSISEARRRLNTLIGNLKDCSLLDDDEHGGIKMHDTVRSAAIWIASGKENAREGHVFKNKDGNVLTEWPGDISNCTEVSISNSIIRKFPEDLGCPNVECLLLFSNRFPINIPELAFQGTKQLKVVHLDGLEFASMPGSLYSLRNLRSLCLEHCKFLNLATIGQLDKLEILSFRGSDLEALPSGVGQLFRLKLLDLSECSNLSFIPTNVISKLTSLEELLMASFKNWDIEEQTGSSNARLSELECLHELKSLEIFVSDAQALSEYFFSRPLERYHIQIGREWFLWISILDHRITKSMKLAVNTNIDLLKKARAMLKESEVIYLANIDGVTNLSDSLNSKLKTLHIVESPTLQQIVDCGTAACFSALEFLEFTRLKSLVTLCQGMPASESFSKLKTINIHGCPKLKNLFSVSAVRSLPQLENIEISFCNEMEAIFFADEETSQIVEFPRLRRLILHGLAQLRCFLYVGKSLETVPTSTNLMSFFNDKVALPNLEELELDSANNIEMIWCSRASNASGQLTSLEIRKCDQLRMIFPSDILGKFQHLKTLAVERCSSLEVIYQFGDAVIGDPNNDPMIFGLNKLILHGLPRLKHIWKEDTTRRRFGSFSKLESLHISSCTSLENLFPLATAKTLLELKSLHVESCDKLEKIVAGEESTFNIFLKLTSLTLWNLQDLRSFYSFNPTSKLESVVIRGCPKAKDFWSFGEQGGSREGKEFPYLKMSIDGIFFKSNLYSPSRWGHFPVLKSLSLRSFRRRWIFELSECGGFVSIPNLKELIICDSHIKELWGCKRSRSGFDERDAPISDLPSLRILRLTCVGGLRHLGRRDSKTEDPLLPYLETLYLESCKDLISLEPSPSASFRNLSTLVVSSCYKLTELINPSTAETMANLVTLEIWSCRALKEIVAAEEDNDQSPREHIIVFFKLKTLILVYLDSLEGFCMSSCYSFNFPCLEEVEIYKYSSMRTFCNGDAITPKLKNIELKGPDGVEQYWKGDINTTIKQIYEDQLRVIQILRLSEFPQLLERWGKKFVPPFKCLLKLVVDNCGYLSIAIPLNVMPLLSELYDLVVEKCESVEEIFDLEGKDQQDEHHIGLVSELKTLKLTELPKLRHVWNEDPLGILGGFQNLRELKVHRCCLLTHIFTLPVALGLVHLWRLEVKECSLVEVIIKKQGENEKPSADRDDHCITTIFPALKTVVLEELPSLMEFCSGGDYALRCPALDRVTVMGCPRMRLLGGSGTGSASTEQDHEIVTVQTREGRPLYDEPTFCIFNDKVKILGLREIAVQWNSSMDKAWHEIVPPSFLHNLRVVKLTGCPADHELFPPDPVQAMPNIYKFLILDSFCKHILPSAPRFDASSFEELKYLELYNLPELGNLFEDEDSQSGSMFYHLEELKVSKCKRLTRLLTSATARGLVYLKKMVVEECESMTEIVSSNKGEIGDEIMLEQLKKLKIHGLPYLASFSSGNDTFDFPLLEEMIVRGCPNMKTFSKNVPSTPMLDEIQIGEKDEDEWRWEGGLNSTIEKLFFEMNPSSTT